MEQIKVIQQLIQCFRKYPTIGYKTAERLAYATLELTDEEKDIFIQSLTESKEVKKCPNCGMYYEDECPICSDTNREQSLLLVVSSSKDILSIEKTEVYHGRYFALNSTLSAIHNRTVESTLVNKLLELIKNDSNIKEVILAIETSLEGEMTSSYIANHISNKDIKVSRIAYGIPVGTSLEYLDQMTILQSIKGRTIIKKD